MNKTMLKTVAVALVALAVIYRVPQAKATLTGDDGSWF